MVTQRSKKSFPSLDDLLISSDGHVLSDNTDGGEEEDKQRHNDVNIMTKIDYDSQAILDRIGKCPNEYHNLYQQSKERGIPHIRQDETWDCGTYNATTTTATTTTAHYALYRKNETNISRRQRCFLQFNFYQD